MKVKLFGEEGSKKVLQLEEQVNAWLKEHPQLKILEIKQSVTGGSLHDTKFYISIWYEDN